MFEKEMVLKSIQELPDRFSFDEIVDKLIFLQKIERGLEQVKKGETISTKEFEQRYKKWLK